MIDCILAQVGFVPGFMVVLYYREQKPRKKHFSVQISEIPIKWVTYKYSQTIFGFWHYAWIWLGVWRCHLGPWISSGGIFSTLWHLWFLMIRDKKSPFVNEMFCELKCDSRKKRPLKSALPFKYYLLIWACRLWTPGSHKIFHDVSSEQCSFDQSVVISRCWRVKLRTSLMVLK